MNILSRPQRFVWVLGILLLVGSAAGAGWFFNHNDKGNGSAAAPPEADFIIGQGHADMPEGIASLFPIQPGRVTAVYVTENDAVSEGQLLLSTDDRFSRQKWEEANADLQAARDTLHKAELAVKDRQYQIDLQKIKIEGMKHALQAQRAVLAAKEKLYPNYLNTEELTAQQQLVKVEEAKVAGETLLLKRLQEIDVAPLDVSRAQQDVAAKRAKLEQARLGVLEHDVYAPADGTILRVTTRAGELLGSQSKMPAIQFCPRGERIVRVEVQQEWAGKIAVGQSAVVEDESRAGARWEGKVTRVSDWFAHRRSMLQEPFQINDVRTLECIVSVAPGGRPLRIGQRLRVTIKQGGP